MTPLAPAGGTSDTVVAFSGSLAPSVGSTSKAPPVNGGEALASVGGVRSTSVTAMSPERFGVTAVSATV